MPTQQQLDELRRLEDYVQGCEIEDDDGEAFLHLFIIVRGKCINGMANSGISDAMISRLLSITPEKVASQKMPRRQGSAMNAAVQVPEAPAKESKKTSLNGKASKRADTSVKTARPPVASKMPVARKKAGPQKVLQAARK
ncbi:hypothetical protein P3T23_009469 [Paraburkholderia sp. GAS448]|uniref:hypothetical protein n=1 Tax=Paraburkholderia sp. GAS448 TaxID=3035136 RepID=UPI003D244703